MERLDFDASLRDLDALGQLAHDAGDPLILAWKLLAWKLYVEAARMLNLRQLGEARRAARDAAALCRSHGWDELERSVAGVLRRHCVGEPVTRSPSPVVCTDCSDARQRCPRRTRLQPP